MVAFFVYSILTVSLLAVALFHPETPEWVLNFGFLGNIALLSIISLLSYLAYQREKHFRHVFFALWIVFAVNALASPIYAVLYSIGNENGVIRSYVWQGMIGSHAAFAWSVTTITVGYIASPRKRLLQTAIAGFVLFIFVFWLYSPYIVDPLKTQVLSIDGKSVSNYENLESSSIILNLYSLLVLLAFYVHKYRTDRPIGAYADSLLFLFGLALAIDTAEMLLPSSAFEFLVVSQWAILLVNIGIALCLVLRLKFKSQSIADYYESQCISDDPAIDRRIGRFDRFILRSFFDPEKIGAKIFLGTGSTRMKVRRTPTHVVRRANG